MMKKFVIVMISFLVLFIFLVLNYLLWDKENLLKQRDSDKIEQDWLRGQNRTLQTTIEELEQDMAGLEDQNSAQRDKIAELEQQIRLALQRENVNLKDIQEKDQALGDYKALMAEDLEALLTNWFDSISKSRYEESFNRLDPQSILWGHRFDLENYISFISSIGMITLKEETKDSNDESFMVLDSTEPTIIETQARVSIKLKEGVKPEELESGALALKISFKYDRDASNWAIMSVETLRTGNP